MNYQEQIRSFQQKRNEAVERQAAIMQAAGDEGRTLDAEEQSEWDGLDTEVKHVDDHLVRLRKMAGETASPTEEVKGKAPTVFVRKQDKDEDFEGQNFTRRVIARTLSKLDDDGRSPGQIAEERWGKSAPTLVRVIKAGIPGGSAYGTGSDSWGTELVSADNRFTGDFVEFLAGMTVFDRLPLREIPANVSVKGQDGIGTGYWVGEKQAIKMSAQDFSDVQLTAKKVAGLTVVSKELLRYSSPAAERLLRDALLETLRQVTDTTFFGTAGSSASTPAGILNGVAAQSTEGADADGVRGDINKLYALFIAAKNASGLSIVTTPTLAKTISLMRNALGQREFGDLGAAGGTLEGDPVYTGDNVTSTHFILLKPSDIWRIGDMGVEVSLSQDATIEMDTTPTGEGSGPTAASASLVNMFQTDQVAFKVVRPINFAKRRTSAVQYVNNAAYTVASS
jgi:HK97 family phage major capsid protein